MTLKQTLSRHPLLGLCLCIMALLGLAGALITLHFAGEQQVVDARHYGEALAERAASQAVEPALSQDMISLQVILQAVAQQARVSGATIHDVENRLLVQSGSGETPLGFTALTFTAPITLDTHIAGHLSVTLAIPPTHQVYATFLWAWTLIVVLAMAICALAYRHLSLPRTASSRKAEQVERSEHEHDSDIQDDYPATDYSCDEFPTMEDEPGDELEPASASHAVAVELQLLNINTLKQQLSLSNYQQCVSKFDQLLKGILALYAGEKSQLDNDHLVLTVTCDTQDDASFYGICIGHLACQLTQQQSSPRIKVAARVLPAEADTEIINELALTSGCIWVDPRLHSEILDSHIDLSEQQTLSAIKPPYQALLQRQSAQLLNALR